MEMMRKALEYCQSPIYGVERALERERSSDRERISEREGHGSRREWSPTQEIPVLALCTRWGGSTLTRANGGYGFTSIRWRQQGCCQTATVRKHQCSRKQTFISAGCSNQRNMSLFSTPLEGRICRALWKMTSGDDNLQTKGENERPIREITENGHYGKSKWWKSRGGAERRRDGPAAVWGCRAETRLLVATEDVLYSSHFSSGTKISSKISPNFQHQRIDLWQSQSFSEQQPFWRVTTVPKLDFRPSRKLPEKKNHKDWGTHCSSAGQSRGADCGVNSLEHNAAMGRDWQEWNSSALCWPNDACKHLMTNYKLCFLYI